MEGKLDNTQKIVYVAELDQDIDDIIAAEYLFRQNVLKEVVLDPFPKDELGKQRLKMLQDQGIKVSDSISDGAEIVFIGGALTAVAKYISNNKGIKLLVMNGGFVGKNLVSYNDILPKFKNKEFVRTFNFNIDVRSTDIVMRSTTEQIGKIVLVGKNVCHSDRNTKLGLWNKGLARELLDEFRVRDEKKQHDLLACHEGLVFAGLSSDNLMCDYQEVYPVTENGLEGNMTKWGSTQTNTRTPYRKVTSAVRFAK